MKKLLIIFLLALINLSCQSQTPGQKISDMPTVSSVNGNELIPCVYAGSNYVLTPLQLQNFILGGNIGYGLSYINPTLSVDTARKLTIGVPTIYFVDSNIQANKTGGTVISVATSFGLLGGPITNSGTISIDTVRGKSIGMPTIYFVDSSIAAASVVLPLYQIPYGTGSGYVTSANFKFINNIAGVSTLFVMNSINNNYDFLLISESGTAGGYDIFKMHVPSYISELILDSTRGVLNINNGNIDSITMNPVTDTIKISTLAGNGTGPVYATNNGGLYRGSGGGGSGTVTSITASSPLTGGTITTSGSIGITQATTSTSGYLSSTDWNTFNGKGIGTVTSVAASNGFGLNAITGTPITTSGTFGFSIDTVRGRKAGVPTIYFVDSNIQANKGIAGLAIGTTTISSGSNTYILYNNSGVLDNIQAVPALNGGTGQTTYNTGDILAANSTSSLARIGDVATGQVLLSGGLSTLPSYGRVDLTSCVVNALPIANGGTGQTDANDAFNALAPSQSSNSGFFLTTDGTNTSWAATSTIYPNEQLVFGDGSTPGGQTSYGLQFDGSNLITQNLIVGAATTSFNGVALNWTSTPGAQGSLLTNDGSSNVSWNPASPASTPGEVLTNDGSGNLFWLDALNGPHTLPAYADDATAGSNGLMTGDLYQTDGTGALTTPGIVMIKQ